MDCEVMPFQEFEGDSQECSQSLKSRNTQMSSGHEIQVLLSLCGNIITRLTWAAEEKARVWCTGAWITALVDLRGALIKEVCYIIFWEIKLLFFIICKQWSKLFDTKAWKMSLWKRNLFKSHFELSYWN